MSNLMWTTFLSFSLLVGCGVKDGEEELSSNENVMRGVAATGAPISKGKVEVKGKNGNKKETETDSKGNYSANISELTEPYLVRVLAPTGEKYITVASKSALASGKKINVTPLTHTIVANVFQQADADTLFDNFESEAAEFTEEKLESEKDDLLKKFVDAGLLGSGKIADADIDLLNGTIQAGTSNGIDGLLDVIDVKTDSSSGIEISLKGTTTVFITDDPTVPATDGSETATTVNSSDLTIANNQLTDLAEIRTVMNSLASTYSGFASCSGQTISNSGNCAVSTMYNAFKVYFHTSFQEDGLSGIDEGTYGWICEEKTEQACIDRGTNDGKTYEFKQVSLTDVTILDYDDTNDIAYISFNLYFDGKLRGIDHMRLKRDGAQSNAFKLFGNEKTFEYYIDAQAMHHTEFNMTSQSNVTDKTEVNLSFYLDDSGKFTQEQTLTLTALSGNNIFSGGQSTMSLYVVKAPMYDDNNNCTEGFSFSTTASPYKKWDVNGTESYANYTTACSAGNACNCSDGSSQYNFDWDKNRAAFSQTQVSAMNKVELIQMSGTEVTSDKFYIKKPLYINSNNSADYMPSFGMSVANFCNSTNSNLTLSLNAGSNYLGHVSLWYGYTDASNNWYNTSAQKDFWDSNSSSSSFNPLSEGMSFTSFNAFEHKNLWLSSRDEFDREFVRRVDCHK